MKPDLKDPANWIPKDLFLSYVGEDASGKLAQFYDKAVSKKNILSWSLNWLALLILPAWFGYRKQWVLWGVYTGIMVVLPIFEGLFHISIPNSAFIGINIGLATMANGLMLSTATQRYLKLKQAGLNDLDITEKMRDQAKKSVPLAVALCVASVAIITVCGYITDMFILKI